MNQVTVFFEGLGIPRFSFNKTAFTLFGRVDVTWSALILLVAFLAGTVFALCHSRRREGISGEDLFELILCGLLGSRVLYLAESFGAFRGLSWSAELCFFGSLALAVLFPLLIARFLRVRADKAADILAPALLLGLCIGAFAAFADGNADSVWMRDVSALNLFGKTVSLPTGAGTLWHLFRMGLYPNNEFAFYMIFVHPLFLYLSVWCLLGFVFSNLFYRHKAFDGQIFLLSLVWVCLGMAFICGLSTAPIARTVQWLAAIAAFLAVVRLIVLGVAYRRAKRRLEAGLLVIVRGDSAVQ